MDYPAYGRSNLGIYLGQIPGHAAKDLFLQSVNIQTVPQISRLTVGWADFDGLFLEKGKDEGGRGRTGKREREENKTGERGTPRDSIV
jgi:hypothetical protein